MSAVPFRWIILSFALLSFAKFVAGGTSALTGGTTVTVTSFSVQSYSHTEIDYNAADAYDVETDAYLYQDYTQLGHQTVQTGDSNSVSLYGAPSPNHWYSGGAYHLIIAYYYVYVAVYDTYEYYDPFSWDLLGNPNPPDGGPYVFTTNVYCCIAYLVPAYIEISQSGDGDGTYAPNLDAISVSGLQVRGGSGSISLYGGALTTRNSGLGVVNIPGVTITGYTFLTSAYPWQISFNYTIPANTATGGHNVTVSTVWGTSNPLTFTVYDPTPAITSISPDPWVMASTTNFTISGSGFGSSPSLSVSGSRASATITSASDTQIAASLSWFFGGSPGTASVVVTSNGYGGNTFQQAPQGGSTNQTSRSVQVVSQFTVEYVSYIPVDHVSGPTTCTYNFVVTSKIYMGDGGRGTYRTKESVVIVPDGHVAFNFFPDTGFTRNYGFLSPVNGTSLTSSDEDGVSDDCYLWNKQGHASTGGFSHSEGYQTHQATVQFSGSAGNPLESLSNWAPITWNLTTTVNVQTPSNPTAAVNYLHTCYPAHQVKVNSQIVYSYMPLQNDITYITGCLSQVYPLVSGQTSPQAVPIR